MVSKTTVAIDVELRKRLKKIGVLLDLSQQEVIERAVRLLEQEILSNSNQMPHEKKQNDELDINQILENASLEVCAKDPEHKKVQETLKKGPITIDDIISSNWVSGLDFE
jgi:hypothetical protein